jgi:cysteine-rich repeat protein
MRVPGLLCLALIVGCDRYMEPPDSPAIDTRQETLEGALGTACGNGVREPGEQCDDGGQVNLDGCSATCLFEQLHRFNYVQMQFAGDLVCPLNALGGAIVGDTARSELQSNLDAGIKDGSLTALLQLLGLDDLTGNDDRSVGVGILGGTPVAGIGYDGANDLDWWYQIDATSVDALRNPLSILTGNITTRLLTTQPSNLDVPFQSGTAHAVMRASNARLSVVTGASSAPLTSGGAPPGHLASEHLDPTLVSFATAGERNDAAAGRLCGNLSAKSLSQVPIPAPLLAGGLLSCMEGYGTSNSLLDMIVGGCTVLFVRQTRATQPDTEDPMAPPAGAGPGYTLIRNSQRQVSGCTDASGAAVDLETCLNDAAYSAFAKFASGRVIAR